MDRSREAEPIPKAPDVIADFTDYAQGQALRFAKLSDFLRDSLGIVEDADNANKALEAGGRPDLAITERAEMWQVEKPEEVTERCNNFTPSFVMYTDRIEPPEGSLERPTFIPIAPEELLGLRDLPKIESFEQLRELEGSGNFTFPNNAYITHIVKPAFLRMLILFPDFTVDLVTRMSNDSARHRELRFEPELFVAYQIMSRLVDVEDYSVVNEEGQTQGYLGR